MAAIAHRISAFARFEAELGAQVSKASFLVKTQWQI
jgi:hypothetical protein